MEPHITLTLGRWEGGGCSPSRGQQNVSCLDEIAWRKKKMHAEFQAFSFFLAGWGGGLNSLDLGRV